MNEDKLNQMAEFIHRYISENNGESPKFKDILEYMEMSKSVGYRYLTTLRDRGVIKGYTLHQWSRKDEVRVPTCCHCRIYCMREA